MRKATWRPVLALPGLCVAIALALSCCLACVRHAPSVATPTPDIPALETQVAFKLGATLTAKAPTPTSTPTPTPIPPTVAPLPLRSPTPSPLPAPTGSGPLIAYVRVGQDKVANISLYDVAQKKEDVLTHFVEPMNMSDVSWSKDGQWLIFVSAHDYIHSRNNERNIFLLRPNGTDLRMVTGEYVDPAKAPGPYIVLQGKVAGAKGTCVVCAQGTANPAPTEKDGSFSLSGVPASAAWARAVCQEEQGILQGDLDLTLRAWGQSTITITVESKGQGWTQARLARDGQTMAGMRYQWVLDKEGKRQIGVEGVLQSLSSAMTKALETPPGTTLGGLDWASGQDRLVGALTGPKSTFLWLWDATGASIAPLVQITNTEQAILTASNPAWSPDGARVAFGLHHWYWWGENKYKTELMVVSASGQELTTLVPTDWGIDANNPSWADDSARVFYQRSEGAPQDSPESKANGSIWSIALAPQSTPTPWMQDGGAYLPAVRPPLRPTPTP